MQELREKIDGLLEKLRFKKFIINNNPVYKQGETYYKITFVKGFNAFVVEYAGSKEDAEKDVFEDGDTYPLSLGENFLAILEQDLKKYYLE